MNVKNHPSRSGRPRKIGLTGNIGSGKSTVATLLLQRGAALIDADALARAATDDPDVLECIAYKLGGDLVKNGQLDRQATAQRVFSDPQARQVLNGIVHPWVRARSDEQVQELLDADPPPPVILMDIPLLYENGLERTVDAVIVVDAPLDVRIARVMNRSGLRAEEVRARDAAQMPLEEKVRRADYIVHNEGDLKALEEQVADLWAKLTRDQA